MHIIIARFIEFNYRGCMCRGRAACGYLFYQRLISLSAVPARRVTLLARNMNYMRSQATNLDIELTAACQPVRHGGLQTDGPYDFLLLAGAGSSGILAAKRRSSASRKTVRLMMWGILTIHSASTAAAAAAA